MAKKKKEEIEIEFVKAEDMKIGDLCLVRAFDGVNLIGTLGLFIINTITDENDLEQQELHHVMLAYGPDKCVGTQKWCFSSLNAHSIQRLKPGQFLIVNEEFENKRWSELSLADTPLTA